MRQVDDELLHSVPQHPAMVRTEARGSEALQRMENRQALVEELSRR